MTNDHITTDFSESLIELVTPPFRETWELREQRSLSPRLAAYGLGVTRVAEASLIRGLYP